MPRLLAQPRGAEARGAGRQAGLPRRWGKSGAAPQGGRSARPGSARPRARKCLPWRPRSRIREGSTRLGTLRMRQEGITHIPPMGTRVPLEQSRSCLSVQPALGTGSQLRWERCGSLSFPTVSTCLEVTSYDLQGNPVSRFYCPEKEMGMINQGDDEEPLPPPLRSLQPPRAHGLSERPGSAPRSHVP